MVGRRHLAGQLPERHMESAMQFARVILAAGIVALPGAGWNIHAQDAVSKEQFDLLMREVSNQGRWGAEDELGTVNLITPSRRIAAARLVMDGITLSLAHETLTDETADNPNPYTHSIFTIEAAPEWFFDRIEVGYHGFVHSHLDALCHIFAAPENALYNGRPTSDVTMDGAGSGSVEPYHDGIVTRGVLYDVPRHRGTDFVTIDAPAPGWELEDIAAAQGVEPRPGDAVVVRSGANAFYASRPDFEMGMFDDMPGVHGSAIEFLYNNDASVLVWDLLDAGQQPLGYGLRRPDGAAIRVPIHEIVIPYMGMPLLDNANLDDLADACDEAGRYEFLLMVAPLRVRGGTGSPVNPIAVI